MSGIPSCVQVNEGETYELVISNTSGLLRHRLGDVVKVVGRYNNMPEVNASILCLSFFGYSRTPPQMPS